MKSTTEAGLPKRLTSMLAEKHRTLEIVLDQLLLDGTANDRSGFHDALTVLKRHYGEEEELLTLLAGRSIPLAHKMIAQHEEACEIGRALIEALERGDERDAGLLLKRFRAIVEHNIIEEERDLFPIAERALTTQDVLDLLRKLPERDKA